MRTAVGVHFRLKLVAAFEHNRRADSDAGHIKLEQAKTRLEPAGHWHASYLFQVWLRRAVLKTSRSAPCGWRQVERARHFEVRQDETEDVFVLDSGTRFHVFLVPQSVMMSFSTSYSNSVYR